jgi:microcystin-dependent protein
MIRYNAANARWELLNPVASSFTTGDVKTTLKSVADAGWVMMNDGTIGDASSGGTTRANADTQALYALLWTNVSNANCPVSGGRGASAAADFAAHKTIALPKMLGRAMAAAGAGAGLSTRNLGDAVGEEAHILTMPELAPHQHGLGFHKLAATGTIGGSFYMTDTSPDDSTESTGSGAAHNNTQPTTFVNIMIKL